MNGHTEKALSFKNLGTDANCRRRHPRRRRRASLAPKRKYQREREGEGERERERERKKERKKERERDGFAFFRHSACDAFINMCVCVLGGGEGGVVVGRQCSLGKRL